jgi:PIN domain nuclease of toxin-antitoxin system
VGSSEVIALDTHFWIWFQFGDPRLTATVASQINRNTVLPAASILEAMVLIEKGRIKSRLTPEETVLHWLNASPMRVVPIDSKVAIASRTLKFKHADPADRFIAATAKLTGVPLATLDQRLIGLDWLETIS